MRPCLLFMLAIAVVAIAICGPPAVNAGETDLTLIMQTGPVTVESPALQPAASWVVRDPGSCVGLSAIVVTQRLNILPTTRPIADFQRWRCRLLIRLPCGC